LIGGAVGLPGLEDTIIVEGLDQFFGILEGFGDKPDDVIQGAVVLFGMGHYS
jgi:hypothetical protein